MTESKLMENTGELFTKLLDQYVFSVAANFIDLVGPAGQAQLIKLIQSIGDNSATSSIEGYSLNSTTNNSTELSPKVSLELPAESFAAHLERQWQEALSKPISKKKNPVKNSSINTQRLIACHQTNIDFTVTCIHKLEKLITQAEKNISSTNSKVIVVAHYQSLLNTYRSYLAKIQDLQQKESNKLTVVS